MIKKYLFAFLATVLLLSSCSITTHIHFNKDNSGNVKIEINYGEMMAEMDDSTKINFKDSIMSPFQDMSGLEKLKNYKMEFKGTSLILSYDFATIEDLNTSLSTIEKGEDSDKKEKLFSAKKKSITYTAKKAENTEEEVDEMGAMFPVTFKVSFERKISKCSNKAYKVNKDEKYIEFTGNANDFSSSDKMNFTVKLK